MSSLEKFFRCFNAVMAVGVLSLIALWVCLTLYCIFTYLGWL